MDCGKLLQAAVYSRPWPALARLVREASAGDVVVVTRLDRLARSTRDLLNTLDQFGKSGVGFKSLRETSVDTTSPQGRLVVSILASISEFERELIAARMSEGRKRAKANGVKFGPKHKLSPYQRQEASLGWRRARARAWLRGRTASIGRPSAGAQAGSGVFLTSVVSVAIEVSGTHAGSHRPACAPVYALSLISSMSD